MTGQQRQPLLCFITAPVVFIVIFCTIHDILDAYSPSLRTALAGTSILSFDVLRVIHEPFLTRINDQRQMKGI